jgi:hypothetical protein
MEMLNLLCTSEEIKSTGSNRKVATKKLKTTTRLKKMKPGTLPQTNTIQKTLEFRLIRPQTLYKEPEHMHLKSVTLLNPVEKITKFHGFKQFKHLDNSLLIEGYQMSESAVLR